MRIISPDQFFALSGQAKGSFKASVSRGEAALAFGTEKELAGGNFLDLDVVAIRLSDNLTPAFGRRMAATLVRGFSDIWLEGVSRAERETAEPMWLLTIETGKLLSRAQSIHVMGKSAEAPRLIYEGVNVGCATLAEAGAAMREGHVVPHRMTFINLTSLINEFRADAARLGIPLPDFLVPPLDDPEFAAEQARFRATREALVERVRTAAQE